MQLVRQKFLNEASTTDEDKLQMFISELYSYLVDEMHKALKDNVFGLEGPKEESSSPLDCDSYQVFASEAKVCKQCSKE